MSHHTNLSKMTKHWGSFFTHCIWGREILYNSIFTWLARLWDNGQWRGLEWANELLKLTAFERANITADLQLVTDVSHEMVVQDLRGLEIQQ